MSETMRLFLTAYLAFCESDAREHDDIFDKGAGMCSNVSDYVARVGNVNGNCEYATRRVYRDELHRMLEASDLDIEYPFGEEEYIIDCRMGSHHRNAKRINWIKEQLAHED